MRTRQLAALVAAVRRGLQGVSPPSPGALKLELPAGKCCGQWGMSAPRRGFLFLGRHRDPLGPAYPMAEALPRLLRGRTPAHPQLLPCQWLPHPPDPAPASGCPSPDIPRTPSF